jgi:fatty acid amide hydrolase 2
MESLLGASGLEIARKIRTKKISSRDAVELHIGQIEKVNPSINALVADRFEEARKEADLADALVKKGPVSKLPPYHGVPCTIKEAFAVTGMPNASGLVSRRNIISSIDATCVARLKKAGAIPLGVTNTPELCMWIESYNNVYGRTSNAYDLKRTSGGSSGGEGALIGSGASPFGLGSDFAGSIRIPSFFNGVFGHKPTGGLAPGTGHYPAPAGPSQRFATFGPLARRAADLLPLLKIIAGPDGSDDYCEKHPFVLRGRLDLRGLDVILLEGLENWYISSVSDELIQARERCARELEKQGARIRTLKIDLLRHIFMIWVCMVHENTRETFREILTRERPITVSWEMLKGLFGASDYTQPIKNIVFLEDLARYTPGMVKKYAALGLKLKAELDQALGKGAIILFPPYPYAAPRHYDTLVRSFNLYFTGVFNIMEYPATQVPLGLNARGLPLGVQVVSNRWNDGITIAVAENLEKVFGGWVPPARWTS